jgi:hypothetical protein
VLWVPDALTGLGREWLSVCCFWCGALRCPGIVFCNSHIVGLVTPVDFCSVLCVRNSSHRSATLFVSVRHKDLTELFVTHRPCSGLCLMLCLTPAALATLYQTHARSAELSSRWRLAITTVLHEWTCIICLHACANLATWMGTRCQA